MADSSKQRRRLQSYLLIAIHIPLIESFQISRVQTRLYNNHERQGPSVTRLLVSTSTNPPTTITSSADEYTATTNSLLISKADTTSPLLLGDERQLVAISINETVSSFVTTVGADHDDDKEKTNIASTLFAKIYEKIGSIDEDRYVSPEYVSGDVPRLFSTLQYETSDTEPGKVIGVKHSTGSIIGSAALIAGTTVGAGVLALPAATAGAGFLPSTVAMFIAYGYMVVSGLLIAELQLNRLGTTGRPGTGLLDLYNNSLAGPIALFGTIAYFFNHYALMVAYIAQGGSSIASLLPDNVMSTLPPGTPQLAFTAIVATVLYSPNTKTMEKVNNVLVGIFLTAFVAIVASAAGTADFGALVSLDNQHPEKIVDCFPILFLAFVYQNVVPTVVTQLEGDRWKIIWSILAGTTVPLLMFLTWNAVILGNVAAAGIDPSTLDPAALLTSGALGEVGPAITAFSLAAVSTSIVGFTYGLLESWKDTIKIKAQEGTAEYQNWKPALYSLVFIPPLAMAIADPSIFYNALEYGGAFGVSTLFLILPPIMVWKERYGDAKVPLLTKPMVPLGKIPLGSMWKAAGTLILEQGAEKLGIFDFLQDKLNL